MAGRTKNPELQSKAKEYGFNSIASFRQALDRGQIKGAIKDSKGQWIFPNKNEPELNIFNDDNFQYPEIDESKKRYEYFRQVDMKAKAESSVRANLREKGRLVDKNQLENKYASELTTLRDKLLEIPITIKSKLGDSIDDDLIEIIRDSITNTLKDFVNEKLS